jgi:hypothetical protein
LHRSVRVAAVRTGCITTRKGPRYEVRYRLGGHAYPIAHGGSFKTLREARARRDLIAGELAAGRNPADALDAMTQQPTVRTFAQWAEAYRESRPDIGDETRKNTASHLKRLLPAFGIVTRRRSRRAMCRSGLALRCTT